MRVTYKGQPVDASTVNWSQVDIRRFNFIQPPGPKNVLGVVKFRFPNRHDVYMHDTPGALLVRQAGPRVQPWLHARPGSGPLCRDHPRRGQGLVVGPSRRRCFQVRSTMRSLCRVRSRCTLLISRPIADADGKVRFTGDPYGKDARLATALAGRPVNLDIPPEPVEAQVAGARQGRPRPPRYEGGFDFFSGLFGN